MNLYDYDFHFAGGSVLNNLCTQSVYAKVIVFKVPQLETIIISTLKDYNINPTKDGIAFERFCTVPPNQETTPDADYLNVYETVRHLHQGKVGGFNVLFRGETDAISNSSIAEIKMSCTNNNRIKTIIQMINNGASKVCYGVRYITGGQRTLRRRPKEPNVTIGKVIVMSLSSLVKSCSWMDERYKTVDLNKTADILPIKLELIKRKMQMKDIEAGKAYEISFGDIENNFDGSGYAMKHIMSLDYPNNAIIAKLLD